MKARPDISREQGRIDTRLSFAGRTVQLPDRPVSFSAFGRGSQLGEVAIDKQSFHVGFLRSAKLIFQLLHAGRDLSVTWTLRTCETYPAPAGRQDQGAHPSRSQMFSAM